MNNEKLLKYFEYVYNMSTNQVNMLYELCNNDFEMLMELSTKLKAPHTHWTPSYKDEVNEVLKFELK